MWHMGVEYKRQKQTTYLEARGIRYWKGVQDFYWDKRIFKGFTENNSDPTKGCTRFQEVNCPLRPGGEIYPDQNKKIEGSFEWTRIEGQIKPKKLYPLSNVVLWYSDFSELHTFSFSFHYYKHATIYRASSTLTTKQVIKLT